MTSLSLSDVTALIEARDAEIQANAQSIRDKHQTALDGALMLRDELAEANDSTAKRPTLVGIIEAAASTPKPSKTALEVASGVFAQYLASIAQRGNVSPAQARNGAFVACTAIRYTGDWTPSQRQKVLTAITLAAMAKIDAGLVEFPAEDWHREVTTPDLERWAEILDADSIATLRAQEGEIAQEYGQAMRMVDALEQAAPRLYVTNMEGQADITVANHRGGSVAMAGVRFEPGQTTLTADQFNQVRNHPTFKAHQSSGVLRIVSSADLAREVAA